MKIVFIIKSFAMKAGVERLMSDKMNYMAEKGHKITLVTYEQGTHPMPFALHPSITHIDLNTNVNDIPNGLMLQIDLKKMKEISLPEDLSTPTQNTISSTIPFVVSAGDDEEIMQVTIIDWIYIIMKIDNDHVQNDGIFPQCENGRNLSNIDIVHIL